MKNSYYSLILLGLILSSPNSMYGQGLILPMPGMKPTHQNSNTQQTTTPSRNNNSQSQSFNRNNQPQAPNGSILPLPQSGGNYTSQPSKPQQPEKQPPITTIPQGTNRQQPISGNQTFITIPTTSKPVNKKYDDDFIPPPPPPKPQKATAKPSPSQPTKPTPPKDTSNEEDLSSFFNDTDFPVPGDDFDTSSNNGNKVEDLLPPTSQETTVSNNSNGESITVYPKDTGSAIFMVMKSWKCDDYDSSELLSQAIEVYGKESDDVYQINGLNNIAKGTSVNIEEEDITLDELLDILASKTGNDWGADVPNKTLYIYPKGIKTESYVSWE